MSDLRGNLLRLNLANGMLERMERNLTQYNSAKISRDGTMLLMFTRDDRAYIQSIASGKLDRKELRLSQLKDGFPSLPTGVFSRSNKYVLTGGFESKPALWLTKDTTLISELEEQGALALGFGASDRYFAVGDKHGKIDIYEIVDERPTIIRTIPRAHDLQVYSIDFDPRRQSEFVSVGADGKALIWDAESKDVRPLRSLVGNGGPIFQARFSPDGRHIALASEGSIRLWQLDESDASLTNLVGHGGSVYSVDFSPDSKSLVSGSIDGTARIWSVDAPLGPYRFRESARARDAQPDKNASILLAEDGSGRRIVARRQLERVTIFVSQPGTNSVTLGTTRTDLNRERPPF